MLVIILQAIADAGGRAYEVGGCVRDRIIGVESKDVDIEVFQMCADTLIETLRPFGKVDCVGVSFGVIKLNTSDGMEYDFTLPRRESKSGRGHRGFQVEVDHSMSRTLLAEAEDLARQRIWIEWEKWALRGSQPAMGLAFLRQTNWLSLYPELQAIIDVPQDPQWHPEGDVWMHTLHVCDAAAGIAAREQLSSSDRIVLMLAALCHDLGKATHTRFENGRWHAYGHEAGGVAPTEAFLERLGCPNAIREAVVPLVANHLIHAVDKVTIRLVRRLAVRLGAASVKLLVHLIEADISGRPPLPKRLPESAAKILELATDMNIDQYAPKPIVLGRHLIALGHAPAPWFGEILKHCFEVQLDGGFENEDDGLHYLQNRLRERSLP